MMLFEHVTVVCFNADTMQIPPNSVRPSLNDIRTTACHSQLVYPIASLPSKPLPSPSLPVSAGAWADFKGAAAAN